MVYVELDRLNLVYILKLLPLRHEDTKVSPRVRFDIETLRVT
jgi:hypothetical protein